MNSFYDVAQSLGVSNGNSAIALDVFFSLAFESDLADTSNDDGIHRVPCLFTMQIIVRAKTLWCAVCLVYEIKSILDFVEKLLRKQGNITLNRFLFLSVPPSTVSFPHSHIDSTPNVEPRYIIGSETHTKHFRTQIVRTKQIFESQRVFEHYMRAS